MKIFSKVKQAWSWAFGTKYDAGISLLFIALGALGGGVTTLLGGAWWLALIMAAATPLAFYVCCYLFFLMIMISFIRGL